MAQTWDGMANYRDADIDRMVKRVVPVVSGAQRQMAALTTAYLASVASEVLGVRTRPARVPDVSKVRGTPPTEAYRRPGIAVWTALSEGKPLQAAAAEGRARLLSLGATDLQLAKTHAARAAFSGDQRIVGYQRTLSGGEDCALCVVASTQRYHTEDLMPIHPGCDCDVRPLYGDEDLGQVIDPERLERLHAEADEFTEGMASRSGRTGGADYRKIMVRDHGEYGPTLSWRSQDFTGPAGI